MQTVWVSSCRQSRRRSVTLSERDSTNHRISHFVGLPQPSANASGRWSLICDSWRVSIGVSINRSQYQQESGGGMIERREFLMTGGALALGATPLANLPAEAAQRGIMQTGNPDVFWPGGARLVISISMQMEAGAQPESGA